MSFIRSISGIRATLGDGLLPSTLSQYVAAYANLLGKGKIVVGRDGRPSGEWIEHLVVATLQSFGNRVERIGIVPTPTVQLLTEHSDAIGGISITASHNPGEWNGLKFLGPDGVFLDADQNAELFSLVDNNRLHYSDHQNPSEVVMNDSAIMDHVNSILEMDVFTKTDLFEKIRSRKIKAVVDAVNASGSIIVPELLSELGFEIVELFCENDGVFPHTPEPIPMNLTQLSDAVKEHKADIGIAVDPDADRLVIIDENGDPIGEEKTIVLSAWSVFENKEHFKGDSNVVVNLSTSRMIDDLAQEYAIKVHRSPVGEINVVKKMKELNSIFGGEGSGGVILPQSHYGRDSLVGIALIAILMVQKGKSISQLSQQLPNYQILKNKQEFSDDFDKLMTLIKPLFPEAKVNSEDGIRFDLEKSWVQIRRSNTEPIIRIISEAKTIDECQSLSNRIMDIL